MTAHPLRQVALLALLCSVTVHAQNVTCADGSNPQGRVTVTGQGSVTNTPDLATVSETRNKNWVTVGMNPGIAADAVVDLCLTFRFSG
jgi:uncharacterized protein YggE